MTTNTTHITKEALLQAIEEVRARANVHDDLITVDALRIVLARAAELEQSQPAQISHHEDCWRDPKHHACAVAKIEQSSAGNAGEVAGWQPIETAPKDETVILLWQPRSEHGFVVGFWSNSEHFDGVPGWYDSEIAKGSITHWDGEPTQWRPLPEPPHD